jgi:mono/diheme cytochrome c family protein
MTGSREIMCDRHPGRVLTAAMASLILVAGCEKRNAGTATDTTTPAAAPATVPSGAAPDTGKQATATQDTTRQDTTRQGTVTKASDTAAAKPSAAKPAPSPKPTAAKPAPAKAESTQTDTATQTAEAPLRDAYHQPPRDTVSQEVYNGWKQYNLNCARCHGEDALGTTIAPHLIVSLKPDGPISTKELFISTVCAGRPEKGMPAWCSLGLEMDKIQDIYSYVKGRSDGKISPGRPAVRSQG